MNAVVCTPSRASTQDGSEQAGAIKLMNTETYSLNYTDLNAMTRWSDM